MPPPRPTTRAARPRGDRRSCCAKSGFARVMSVPYPLCLLGLLTSSRTVRVLRSRRKIVKITLDFRKFWEILGNDGDTIVRRPSLANQVPLGWNTAHRDSDAASSRILIVMNKRALFAMKLPHYTFLFGGNCSIQFCLILSSVS